MRANEWMDVVSMRLQRQWPSVDPARLDDVAADLWANETLRAMEPASAAEAWLSPVARPAVEDVEQPAPLPDEADGAPECAGPDLIAGLRVAG